MPERAGIAAGKWTIAGLRAIPEDVLIPQRDERYLRDPRLVSRADGGADLHAVAWDTDGEAHVVITLDARGEVGAERVIERRPAILGLGRDRGAPRIADDASIEDRARDGAWSVGIERDTDGVSRVIASGPGVRARVWEARAIAAAPAIAQAPGGAWIAFHHDLREDAREPDVVKWIALRFVSASGVVSEPAAEMVDRDRDREGEEQGFELPEIVIGPGGAIAVYGRGSHRFWRQDLDERGWSQRRALSGEDGWGCRGRRVATCVLADGSILIARREKPGIVIERDTAPAGAAPALSPITSPRIEAGPRRDAPRRPRGIDPATRWGRLTLFGDIHQHSAHSDGCGIADEPYLRARHGYGDDFCALTDHESFLGKRIGPGEWAYLEQIADRHDDPGAFATLIAYEWTGRRHPGPGHKVVYLPGPGRTIVSRDRVPDGRALVAAVKEQGGFAVPHHVGWTGADEEAHDPIGQPVWEICSCHGCYLSSGHPLGARGDLRDQMVEDVLRRGKRFGFIACSDGHGLLWHHGVARKRDPFRTGLTAVQATERTRASILAAIRERRCYATSGVPILLDVVAIDAAGQVLPMGSELRAQRGITIEASAIGTADVASIALVTAGGTIASAEGVGDRASVSGVIEEGWVYAKVVQRDGEMAWSSPIFVDRA